MRLAVGHTVLGAFEAVWGHMMPRDAFDRQEQQYLQQGAAWKMPSEWKPNRGVDGAVMKVLVMPRDAS